MYASRFNFLSSEDHFSETGNYGLAKSNIKPDEFLVGYLATR